MISQEIFCIDASMLIKAYTLLHPLKTSRSLWELMEQIIADKHLITSEMSMLEIKRYDTEVYEWAKSQYGFSVKVNEEILIETQNIVAKHPTLINADLSNEQAAPYLIALAKVKYGHVVCDKYMMNHINQKSITQVCQHLRIKCFDFEEMIKLFE